MSYLLTHKQHAIVVYIAIVVTFRAQQEAASYRGAAKTLHFFDVYSTVSRGILPCACYTAANVTV